MASTSAFNSYSDDEALENECMICYLPGRVKMCHVFTNIQDGRPCEHTYCPSCLEEYLGTMPNLFKCAKEGCQGRCDTVYSLPWIKARNKNLYNKMSIELATGTRPERRKFEAPQKAKFNYSKVSKEDEEAMSEFCRRKRLKQCPSCKNLVERNGGCNHMTCRCGTNFCYCCGHKFNTKEYEAFHAERPMRTLCEVCKSDHDLKDCPITYCGICNQVGHQVKDCPLKVKACPDCGRYVTHDKTDTCSKILIKEGEKEMVEKLKYIGNFIPADAHDQEHAEYDHFKTPNPDEFDEESLFYMKAAEPVLMSEFVAEN
eukprot:Awhi_evm1s6730